MWSVGLVVLVVGCDLGGLFIIWGVMWYDGLAVFLVVCDWGGAFYFLGCHVV